MPSPAAAPKTKPKLGDRPSRGSVFDKIESRKSHSAVPESTWDISNSFLFNLADKDGDGTLDREEFDRVYALPCRQGGRGGMGWCGCGVPY